MKLSIPGPGICWTKVPGCVPGRLSALVPLPHVYEVARKELVVQPEKAAVMVPPVMVMAPSPIGPRYEKVVPVAARTLLNDPSRLAILPAPAPVAVSPDTETT